MLKTLLKALYFLRREEAFEALVELAQVKAVHRRIMREHSGVVIERGVIVLGYEPERFEAAGVRVSQGTILSFGDQVTGYGKITVGQGTWIGQYNNLRVSEGSSIRIGQNCLISQFCTVVSANHGTALGQPILAQPEDRLRHSVCIGDDVWLGAGVCVLPGVSIGRGAVIGANSVVTSSVPEGEIWAGVPARKIGVRS